MKKKIKLMVFSITLVVTLSYFLFLLAPGNVQALNFGINARGYYTTFADTEVLQRELVLNDENDEWEETLEIDITQAAGFALGGNIATHPGVKFIIDGGLATTSDSDKVTTPDGIDEDLHASLMLASLRFTGEINLAEFAEMYDIPSILLQGGIGYYQGFGEIDSSVLEFSEESLEGGNLGFRIGSGISFDINENMSIQGNIGYRILEIPLEQHTDFNGLEISGGFNYNF